MANRGTASTKEVKEENWNVDYTRKVTMPIRDMLNDGKVAFLVDIYGVVPGDLTVIPTSKAAYEYMVGSKPMAKAVKRLGLDPNRFQAVIWDVPV